MPDFAPPIARLIDELKHLPGIGQKTAQRLAFHLLRATPEEAIALADAIRDAKQNIRLCSVCNNITDADPCFYCTSATRNRKSICVVEEPVNIMAIERTRQAFPWLEADVLDGPDYLAFDIPENHELVQAMSDAMRRGGLAPRISAWRAGSDAGFLVHTSGIPCVLFGPGDIDQAAHRPDEWIDLGDLDVAQRVFERLMIGR